MPTTVPGITTRAEKGSALTHTEVDQNFTNLKNAANALYAIFGTVFNPDGTIKDGSITSEDMFSSAVKAAFIDLAHPLGTILPMSGSTAPSAKWVLCDGSAISRTTYADYFALVSTTYGAGDTTTTFNVPDLRGRVPMGAGTGAGLSARTLGAQVGAEEHTLTADELPAHSHTLDPIIGETQRNDDGSGSDPNCTIDVVHSAGAALKLEATQDSGGDQPHANVQPSLVLNFYVKVQS